MRVVKTYTTANEASVLMSTGKSREREGGGRVFHPHEVKLILAEYAKNVDLKGICCIITYIKNNYSPR